MRNTNTPQINDVRALANLMDSKFQLPGGFRIGWDGILGFIPGIGDLITNSFSAYILVRAATLGVSVPVLLRMGGNVLIDNLIDVIPIFGNFFDIFWKANLRNTKLLEQALQSPRDTRRSSMVILYAVLALIFVAIGASLILIFLAIRWVWNFLASAGGGAAWS